MAAPEERRHGSRVDDDVGRDGCRRATPSRTADFEARATQVNAVPSAAADAVASTPPGAAGEPPPAGPLEAIALYDRLLAEYPNYEHNDQVLYQKARAYDELGRTEEAMETMERLIATPTRTRCTTTKCSSGAASTSSRAGSSATPRAPTQRSSRWAPSSSYYELALYKLGLDALQAGVLRGSAAPVHGAARLQGLDRLRLRPAARGGRRAARRGHVPRHQPELLQPRRPGSRAGVLRGQRAVAATRTASTPTSASSTSPSCATTTRRRRTRRSSRSIRSTAPSPHFSMRVVEIYTQGRLPEARAGVEEGVRVQVRLQAEYWRHFDVERVARGAELPEEQPEGPRDPLPRAVPERGARGARSPRTTRRRCAGTASSSSRSRRTPTRRRSTTSSRTCCSRTRTSARRRSEYERTAYDYPPHAQVGGRRLRRDLRAPAAPEGRRRGAAGHGRARHGRELAQLRRHVPGARARRRPSSARPPTTCTR